MNVASSDLLMQSTPRRQENAPIVAALPHLSPRLHDRERNQTPAHAGGMCPTVASSVEFDPPDLARKRVATWPGFRSEIIQPTRPQKFELRFRAPVHLLVAYQQGVRSEGETWVEGTPRMNLKDLRRKLTFVPALSEFREWHDALAMPQMTFFYIEPAHFRTIAALDVSVRTARVLFEDPVLWDTVSKAHYLIESAAVSPTSYLEAVGAVLSHELARVLRGQSLPRQQAKGGLAGWQRRLVVEYIDAHLSEDISLARLAELAKLSPHHFCRAFKHCIGCPPVRYQGLRRIEHGKKLLATSSYSVTDIGLKLGFSETSSFSNAFRRIVGLTPSDFRRSLS